MNSTFYKHAGANYVLKKWKHFGGILPLALIFIGSNLFFLLMHLLKKEGPFLFFFVFSLLPAFIGLVLLSRKITINPAEKLITIQDLGCYTRRYSINDFDGFIATRHYAVVIPIGISVAIEFTINGRKKTIEFRRFRNNRLAQKFISETASIIT